MASTLPNLPIFQAIANHDPDSTAVIHSGSKRSFSYHNLLQDVVAAKGQILSSAKASTLLGERVAFFAENSYEYVVSFLAILANEAVALPLPPSFPLSELRYFLENSDAKIVLSTPHFKIKAEESLRNGVDRKPALCILNEIGHGLSQEGNVTPAGPATTQGGLMLYTSGTTSRPKGVVLTTPVITAQARSLIEAWKYAPSDLILHLLPLHHIHGVINALFTPLLAGSTIEFLFPFNPDGVWKRLAAPFLPSSAQKPQRPITFLTAVPTIYNLLLSTHSSLAHGIQRASREAISPENLRLNISGSAALPLPVKSAWTELSHGNVLLERYGMTEVGMALSCGLDTADRVDGSVGWPLPQVEARLVDVDTGRVIAYGEECDPNGNERGGEIQLRGPTMFSEYWRNPQATQEEFVQDKLDGTRWFKTGDIATRQSVEGAGEGGEKWARGPIYFIQGRKSVDIIKSGGEKVSALEIETVLLSLPQVAEAAVVGIPSDMWGQRIAAVIVLDPKHVNSGKGGKQWGAMDMRRALRDKLANYKIPQEVKIVGSIPRNVMGKVNKKRLVPNIFGAVPSR